MAPMEDCWQGGGGDRHIGGWVFRVAHNLAMNRLRDSRHENPLVPEEWEALSQAAVDPSPTPHEALAKFERRRRWVTAVACLSGQQLQCLNLRAEGFRYREIAEILGVTISTVAESLRRAIGKSIGSCMSRLALGQAAGHPDQDELLLGCRSGTPSCRQAEVLAHLEVCWTCRTAVSRLEATIQEFVSMRNQKLLAQEPWAATRSQDECLVALRRFSDRSASQRFRLPTLALASALACRPGN